MDSAYPNQNRQLGYKVRHFEGINLKYAKVLYDNKSGWGHVRVVIYSYGDEVVIRIGPDNFFKRMRIFADSEDIIVKSKWMVSGKPICFSRDEKPHILYHRAVMSGLPFSPEMFYMKLIAKESGLWLHPSMQMSVNGHAPGFKLKDIQMVADTLKIPLVLRKKTGLLFD